MSSSQVQGKSKPGKAQRSGSMSSDKTVLCPACNLSVAGKAIHCDLCELWHHPSCVNLDDVAYGVLANMDQLWFCPRCIPTGKRIFRMELQLQTLETRLSSLEGSVTSRLNELTDVVAKLSAPNHFENPVGNLNQLITSTVREALEADAKKTIAVLENFETEDDSLLETSVKSFLDKAGFDGNKVLKVRRSGPTITSRRTGQPLPRIVKVECDSEVTRNDLVRTVAKYVDRGKVSKIYARPDRTWQQRETLRKLNAQLQAKRDAGDDSWYIDRNIYELKCNARRMFPRV